MKNLNQEQKKLILYAFRSGIFLMKEKQGKLLKILTSKQMLQKLSIAVAQVKPGNTSENLFNEIRQIIYSLYQAKETIENVYNNIMNYENSKTSDCYRLLLNLTDNIDLRRKDKYIALSNLSIYYTRKKKKSHIKIICLKYQLQHGMENLNYLMDKILYQIFKIILKI